MYGTSWERKQKTRFAYRGPIPMHTLLCENTNFNRLTDMPLGGIGTMPALSVFNHYIHVLWYNISFKNRIEFLVICLSHHLVEIAPYERCMTCCKGESTIHVSCQFVIKYKMDFQLISLSRDKKIASCEHYVFHQGIK